MCFQQDGTTTHTYPTKQFNYYRNDFLVVQYPIWRSHLTAWMMRFNAAIIHDSATFIQNDHGKFQLKCAYGRVWVWKLWMPFLICNSLPTHIMHTSWINIYTLNYNLVFSIENISYVIFRISFITSKITILQG